MACRQLSAAVARRALANAAAAVTPAGQVTLLDGGMGHQLRAMGVDISGPVGSMRRFLGVALANAERPRLVVDAHLAYIDAGAEVITTNSYACVPRCLREGAGDVDVEGLIRQAGALARQAVEERPGRRLRVAGCLPPLAESYRPDRVDAFEANLEEYRRIAAAVAPTSDLLVCETMSTVDEAKAAFTAASETGLPVYVAWTLNEETPQLRSGESIEAAVDAVLAVPESHKALKGLLFNCTAPEVISEAMPILRKLAPHSVQIGGYANGFVTASSGHGEYRDLPPQEYWKSFVEPWVQMGATVVGGCCGVFPRHIEEIHHGLVETGHAEAPKF